MKQAVSHDWCDCPLAIIDSFLYLLQVPRCEKWMKESCVDTLDSINCMASNIFCEVELSAPFFATGEWCLDCVMSEISVDILPQGTTRTT